MYMFLISKKLNKRSKFLLLLSTKKDKTISNIRKLNLAFYAIPIIPDNLLKINLALLTYRTI